MIFTERETGLGADASPRAVEVTVCTSAGVRTRALAARPRSAACSLVTATSVVNVELRCLSTRTALPCVADAMAVPLPSESHSNPSGITCAPRSCAPLQISYSSISSFISSPPDSDLAAAASASSIGPGDSICERGAAHRSAADPDHDSVADEAVVVALKTVSFSTNEACAGVLPQMPITSEKAPAF